MCRRRSAAAPGRRPTVAPARPAAVERGAGQCGVCSTWEGGSLLDLHVHAVGAEGELETLRGRHELHPDAVLVLHRAHRTATAHRRAGGHAGVVAVEVLELVQAVDLAG